MTLDEAKTEFEKGRTVCSADEFIKWANHNKTGLGNKWPMRLAPTGEPFTVMCSGGEKKEGELFPATYPTKELAVEAWLKSVSSMGDRIEKPIVYWRKEPSLEKVTGGWVVYSRLVVSNKASLEDIMYEVHKDNKERVEREVRREKVIHAECQAAISHILEREGLDARIVFYPREK